MLYYLLADKYHDLPRCFCMHSQWSYSFQVWNSEICSFLLFWTFWCYFLGKKNLTGCMFHIDIACRAEIRQSIAHWKERLGHTTIDLGIAPAKLETYQDGEIKATDPVERLESVRGHLVSLPLEFMSREDLRPVFKESEYYASTHVFHWVLMLSNVYVMPLSCIIGSTPLPLYVVFCESEVIKAMRREMASLMPCMCSICESMENKGQY